MTRKIILFLFLIITFCTDSIPVLNGQTVDSKQTQIQLTNDDVLAMVKSGLSSEIIVAKIKNSSNKFDTSPNKLTALKESGVTESIILAMVQSPSVNSLTIPSTEKAGEINTKAKTSKVKVYVYRRKEFSTRNLQPSVYIDGVQVALMDDGKFFIVNLEPGNHNVSSNKGKSGAEINMKAGDEYYFRLSMKPGFMKGHAEIDLQQKEQGAFEIKQMKPLERKWIKDKSVTVEDDKKQL